MKEEILGYVIRVNRNATNDNPTFAGVKEIDYLGRDYTCLGNYGFTPYVTEKGAKSAIKSWEKRFKHPAYNNGWTYIIEKIIPLTKQNIKQFKAEIAAQKKRTNSTIRSKWH